MGRKKQHAEEPENAERWLLTYCDLITLLLAFFVVMYSMSQVDAKKFGSMSMHLRSVLNGQLGVLHGAPALAGKSELGNIAETQAVDLQIVGRQITDEVRGKGYSNKVGLPGDERGLVVRVMDTALFEVGKAHLTPQAQGMLDQLAPHLLRLPNAIRVEGHTDTAPIRTALFPSNWELSAARATAVVRYLVERHELSPLRMSAIGYGEFRPLAPNDSVENMSKNRRIDIVILSGKSVAEEEPPAPKGADSEETEGDDEGDSANPAPAEHAASE